MSSSVSASPPAARAGIVGISGYSGMELARILSRHPHFTLTLAISDKWAGKRVGDQLPLSGPTGDVAIVSQADGGARFGDVDVLFLCTPPEASIELAPAALAKGARVVDLSGGLRLPAASYPHWYGFTHPNTALLEKAVYSMPEATPDAAAKVRTAALVSNPGCYPTASTLSVLPLVKAGLIEPETLIIDAKSGTTGGGRKGTEDWSFSEIDENLRAYRVLRHQHTPEIEHVLHTAGVAAAQVVFTPHLLPCRRGILATAYGRLTKAAAATDANAAVQKALAAFAEGKPFVKIAASPDDVSLRAVVGTNRVLIGARADVTRNVVVVCAAIDNLVKGASGQAVQNANLMFGLPETAGLDVLGGHLP